MTDKSICNTFAEELHTLIKNYTDSGISNAEVIGCLTMETFAMQMSVLKDYDPESRGF